MTNSKTQTKAIAKVDQNNFFKDKDGFDLGQRIAKMLCASDLVPETFRNNIQNTMIALDIANRMNISPLSALQNLYIIQGKPFWNSSFIIATINSCGRFTGLEYEMFGEGDERGCIAFSYDKKTGRKVESPEFTVKQAKEDGLYEKRGSKWHSRSELMLRYRAATLFGRLFAPEMLFGMATTDDTADNEIDAEIVDAETVGANNE